MDMSEIGRGAAAGDATSARAQAEREHWRELISQIGAEIAGPLSAALERINSLSNTGRIDREGLRLLREEVEAARNAGMIGQQLSRFASGRFRQSHERLELSEVLGSVLNHRNREAQARGIVVKPALTPAQVNVDATLLFGLLNSTIDWAMANAASEIEFSIGGKTHPVDIRLECRFERRSGDEATVNPDPATPSALESLTWRLIEQTASTMGLVIERKLSPGSIGVAFDFPRSAASGSGSAGALEMDDGFAPSANSQPLAGSHVLVVASRREMRVAIRDALRNMSLIIDFVNSVEEAAGFCREGLPHAIVIESIQLGDRFARFRDEITAEVPDFVFIEIVEQGSTFEMSGFGGSTMARVGRDVIATSLPSALMFELSKGL